MSIVYLNGDFLPVENAKISPLDRGFLFGDGIYEVIPSYDGKMVGVNGHLKRMLNGLTEIGINVDKSIADWVSLCEKLCELNHYGALGIYIHISRGTDTKRHHAYPEGITPTIFMMTFEIPVPSLPDSKTAKGYSLISTEDLRWQRCHIKSTALLGNVMHYQQGHEAKCNETLLYNNKLELTEASSSNVYIVKDGVVITPPLDNQILPGITRDILLAILREDGSIKIEERVVTLEEAKNADEIWISSSSKEIAPVTLLDGNIVGDGKVGEVWQKAATLYSKNKFNY
ncbi:D-amino acid aminotransferase [Thalassotalea profundi]|uniref:Cytochrome c551 n=1 Tax=Thalassotalea profundi TaxID=2036687 RepID=A0ABQ3J306_9GAMM|nr:D-amino acid aminotransferase [Thalassotalea profundi]GHE98732.1 cytochrome c551 [Thalassotalea profundi]